MLISFLQMTDIDDNNITPDIDAVNGAVPAVNSAPCQKPQKHFIRPAWLRRVVKIVCWIILALVVLPFTIYLPPVQSFLKNVACSQVEKYTGMKVSIERFRLGFPLDVRLEKLLVLDEQRDTMVCADNLIADVKLLPLFRGDLELNDVRLNDGYYRMMSEDSSMYMTIDAGFLKVDGGSSMNLKSQNLNLINPVLKNAKMRLEMDVWKAKPDSVKEPSTMVIRSANITLENVTYSMKMPPYISDLGAVFRKAVIKDLCVDLINSKINVGSVLSDGGDVHYTTCTPEFVASHPLPVDTISPPSPPFAVELGKVDLRNFTALYNTEGWKPARGFDAGYIQVKDLDLGIENLYNCASVVRVPITLLKGRERSGIEICSASGLVDIDSLGIAVKDFAVRTTASQLDMDAYLSYDMMAMNPAGYLKARGGGYIGMADIGSFMPSLKPTLLFIPAASVGLNLDAEGTLGKLTINNLGVDIPNILHFKTGGFVQNALNLDNLKMRLDLDGALKNASPLGRLTKGLGVNIPSFSIDGVVEADRGTYVADLGVRSPSGNISLDGMVSLNAERYDAELNADNLDVAAIMPGLGVGTIDGSLYATGAGFNPTLPRATAHVEADINRADYGGFSYGPLTLDLDIDKSVYDLALNSVNPLMDLVLNATGSIDRGNYNIDAEAQINNLDLKAMGMMEDVCAGRGCIAMSGTADPVNMLFDLDMAVQDIDWSYGAQHLSLPHAADGHFLATTDSTSLRIDSERLLLAFDAPSGFNNILKSVTDASGSIARMIGHYDFDFERLQNDLPEFTLTADIGGSGVVRRFIEPMGYSFDSLSMRLSNSDVLSGDMMLRAIDTGDMRVDTITASFTQKNSRMNYRVNIDNTPSNMPEFAHVGLTGYLDGNRASLALRQHNDKGETGYKLGLTAAVADSVLSLHFTPLNAVIAYKPWEINDDNYIDLGPGKVIKGSLQAKGMGSSIDLKSGMTDENNNYLDLVINNLNIEDFLQLSALAPPMKGNLNTDLHVELRPRGVVGKGTMSLNDFTYEKTRVGNIGAEFKAGSNITNATAGKIDFTLDKEHIMSLRGYTKIDSVKNDYTTKLTLDLDTFPLRVLNPFMDKDLVQLQGKLAGSLALSGTLTSPLLNGDVVTSGVGIYIPMAASSVHISDGEALGIVDNLVKFSDVKLTGANENPVTLNGMVDARKLSDILLDLSLNGRNVVLMDNDRRARSDVFGKLAVNVNATVKGSMSRMAVDGSLSILPATNLTYVLGDMSTAVERDNTTDVVKFVQFNDTTRAVVADTLPPAMQMAVNASLSIVNGAQFTVNLNSAGTNRARILPNGTLNYVQSYMGDSRLNGQLNFSSGQVRYTPPLMTEKVFDFLPDSYVNWSGDMMNPTLHLLASDHMKANVQQQGSNSRLIYFDVGLSVLGTLNAPKVSFDLSTDDDLTVHNELLSMTSEQRSTEAMNLLLYNTYSGPGSKASSNLSGNPLYGFLSGQLNAWAARAIRGVDLSFGIDKYKNTYDGETSTATSYSYQVSKSLFDNRFKIVVGGNYTTNAGADENFVQNLISDISFEYMLKQTQRMSLYLRLFRHTGWESILEGEITETGVGIVMKRKISDLLQIFRFRRRPKVKILAADSTLHNAIAKPVTQPTDSVIRNSVVN